MTSNPSAFSGTEFNFNGVQHIYHGKVRDVYDFGDQLIMIATDRISAFDHILPRPIPYKGQVLNQLAKHFLEATADIVPNWLQATPDPCVSAGIKATPVKLEMVIRAYLCGHAWRLYKSGIRTICGVNMPEGLKENDKFPVPIITPSTKASEGHDMDISVNEILDQQIVSQDVWDTLADYTRLLFQRGTEMAAERGLLLVDTKYEFGIVDGKIILIDEIHTPDSSRYFFADGYELRQSKGENQPQLSKEFVREWLIANGFQGLEGQSIPDMPDELINEISARYIQLYEMITGKDFIKSDNSNIRSRIEKNVTSYLNSLS
ncbi:MAG TPA: phosphoribosylaminoimidazolesuccinocarboxamide synthase [Saprospiraceae bacterium]|nr:phosphoribosylaminoimidazolesuccinocarboxamide synthase [Saprospiraceae bacterium]HRG42739.1 phosphoribosylaminoimidazolesuccinocarboxamide synthase [Saprospiraceae bacterium]